MTKFLVLNSHAKHQIFNGLNTWLLGAVNKLSKNNRSIVRLKEQDKGKLDINLCQTNLERFFNQLSFVYAISQAGSFWIGEEQVKIDKIDKSELADIKHQYKYWERIIATLRFLNVDISRIDISSFKDKDFRDLDMVRRAILDGEEIGQSKDVSGVTTVNVPNSATHSFKP